MIKRKSHFYVVWFDIQHKPYLILPHLTTINSFDIQKGIIKSKYLLETLNKNRGGGFLNFGYGIFFYGTGVGSEILNVNQLMNVNIY